jgi:hypothetical protein
MRAYTCIAESEIEGNTQEYHKELISINSAGYTLYTAFKGKPKMSRIPAEKIIPSNASADRPLVIFVGGFEFPDGNAAATRIISIADVFKQAGFDTVLIGVCRDPKMAVGTMRHASSSLADTDVREVRYPQSVREWMRRLGDTSHVQNLLNGDYAGRVPTIVCYNYPALAQYRLLRLARRYGGQAIGDISEWYATERSLSVKSVIKNIDTAVRMRIVNKQMDGLIVSSPFLDSYYRSHVMHRIKIPTLVERRNTCASAPIVSPDGAPKKLFFAGSGFDAAAIGKTSEGLKDRLDWVLEMLDDPALTGLYYLNVFGVTKSAFCEVCPTQVDRVERLSDRIKFHGRRPRADVIGYLKISDYAFFLRKPTRVTRAGFPTKFSEAISHGTPVLTNPMENLETFLHDGTNGFSLDLHDRVAASQTLQKALSLSPEAIKALKTACLAQTDFRPHQYVDTVRRFISNMKSD